MILPPVKFKILNFTPFSIVKTDSTFNIYWSISQKVLLEIDIYINSAQNSYHGSRTHDWWSGDTMLMVEGKKRQEKSHLQMEWLSDSRIEW
jgi:hypothetical protein